MRSAQKKTPASEKKNGKEQTSGKKLIQARLPFKIVAGSAAASPQDDSVASIGKETLPKKRRLSYEDVTENPSKKVGKSECKENSSSNKSEKPMPVEDVIVLDEEEPQSVTELRTPTSSKKSRQLNKNSSHNTSKSSTPKVQIKLPLSGKKKRKKVDLTPKAKADSDSSDVEFVDEENSHKKIKLSEDSKQEGTSAKEAELIAEKNAESISPARNDKETSDPLSSNKDSSTEENADDTGKDLSANKSDVESRKTKGDVELKSSPKKANPEEDTVNYNTPSRQKNLKVSVKRIRSSKRTEKAKVQTDESHTEAEVQSPSQNVENEGVADCEEVSLSDTEGELDKSSAADTSISSLSKKVLTPKQLKLMEHRKKVREEKERRLTQIKEEKHRKLQEQREERERKLQEEKLQKQKEREEREQQKKKEREEKDEQKRREKEEKEELKRKEKEDKEKKRLAEIEAKNEERRKRDEAKEEERRKKDEERRRKELEKEEEENKKKKAAQAFTKFFVPKTVKVNPEDDQDSKDDVEMTDCLAFRPFQVKGDMKLAPLVRREFKKSAKEYLDLSLKPDSTPEKKSLYLEELKSGNRIPLKGNRTVLKDNDDDVLIIENELETAAEAIFEARPKTSEKCRAKYFFFRENRRPPYYGTWRKKSSVIKARKPFATDKGFFDYEVDSDEEWEEEEPGESLNGSEDEKEESEDDDYEVDNEWFVPHGHLSDEELQNEDELGPDTSREAQKAKLKALQQEFAQEMKKKTEKIKPRLFGAIWEDENGNKPKLCPAIIWDTLCARAMMICETPLVEEPKATEPEPSTPPQEKQKRLEINDDLMVDLIRLVHGNRHSRVFLIKEFIEHVRNTCEAIKNGECLAPTKSMIKEKIDEISEWSVLADVNTKKKNKKKLCWVVSADVLNKYSLDKLGLKNEWSYTLQPKFDHVTVTEVNEETPDVEKTEKPKSEVHGKKKKLKASGITKFAKVLTKEEKRDILSRKSFESKNEVSKTPQKKVKSIVADKPPSAAPTKSATPVVKKRVALLMSVPPGQDFPAKSKNALINKFLESNKHKTPSVNPDTTASSYLTDDIEIIE